jgi:hypothetical protein
VPTLQASGSQAQSLPSVSAANAYMAVATPPPLASGGRPTYDSHPLPAPPPTSYVYPPNTKGPQNQAQGPPPKIPDLPGEEDDENRYRPPPPFSSKGGPSTKLSGDGAVDSKDQKLTNMSQPDDLLNFPSPPKGKGKSSRSAADDAAKADADLKQSGDEGPPDFDELARRFELLKRGK